MCRGPDGPDAGTQKTPRDRQKSALRAVGLEQNGCVVSGESTKALRRARGLVVAVMLHAESMCSEPCIRALAVGAALLQVQPQSVPRGQRGWVSPVEPCRGGRVVGEHSRIGDSEGGGVCACPGWYIGRAELDEIGRDWTGWDRLHDWLCGTASTSPSSSNPPITIPPISQNPRPWAGASGQGRRISQEACSKYSVHRDWHAVAT